MEQYPVDGYCRSEHSEHSEQVSQVIQRNTQFWWNLPNRTWGGMNELELKQLAGLVASEIGVTPQQAQYIGVYFGECICVTFPDGRMVQNTAMMLANPDSDGNYTDCRVILNRSKSLVKKLTQEKSNNNNVNKYKRDDYAHDIHCFFETPQENIIWLLAEELKHAQIKLIGGRKEIINRWNDNYRRNLRQRNLARHGYAEDLEEVAVSRVAVRVLHRIIGKTNPQRGEYFRQLYQRSLTNNRHIVPNIVDVLEATYFD